VTGSKQQGEGHEIAIQGELVTYNSRNLSLNKAWKLTGLTILVKDLPTYSIPLKEGGHTVGHKTESLTNISYRNVTRNQK